LYSVVFEVKRSGADKILLCFHNFDYFTTFVFPTMGTGAMGADLLVTVWAIGQLWNAQGIVSATSRGAPLRVASFGIRHGIPTF
jgi:hypothetical protein